MTEADLLMRVLFLFLLPNAAALIDFLVVLLLSFQERLFRMFRRLYAFLVQLIARMFFSVLVFVVHFMLEKAGSHHHAHGEDKNQKAEHGACFKYNAKWPHLVQLNAPSFYPVQCAG